MIGEKIESHYFLYNLQIFFPGSPDFPFPGVGKSESRDELFTSGIVSVHVIKDIWVKFFDFDCIEKGVEAVEKD